MYAYIYTSHIVIHFPILNIDPLCLVFDYLYVYMYAFIIVPPHCITDCPAEGNDAEFKNDWHVNFLLRATEVRYLS